MGDSLKTVETQTVRAAVDHLAWTRSSLETQQNKLDQRLKAWFMEREAIERQFDRIEGEVRAVEDALSLLAAPSGDYNHFDLNHVVDQTVLALKPDLDDRGVHLDMGLPRPLAVFDDLGLSARLILEALYWALINARPGGRILVRALVLEDRALIGFGSGERWPDDDPTDGAPSYRPLLEFARGPAAVTAARRPHQGGAGHLGDVYHLDDARAKK